MDSDFQSRYMLNYPLFCKEILHFTPTKQQKAMAYGLLAKNFVSAATGTTVGKTSGMASIGLWFFSTRFPAKVICTAPSARQVEKLLFAEFNGLLRRITFKPLKESLISITNEIYHKDARDCYILGCTVPKDQKDKLGDVIAGQHSKNLLFLIDEAPGVPDPVFAGLEGSMNQKNCYCILAGNPTRAEGYFFDTHHSKKDHWYTLNLSSRESPFVSKENIARLEEIYGADSDFIRTKIDGLFPRGGSTRLVTEDMLVASFGRHKTTSPEGTIVAGLDPAAGGNDYSVLTFRAGFYIIAAERIHHKDTTDLKQKIIERCIARKTKELYIEYINIGINVYDDVDKILRPKGIRCFKVVPQSRASDPEAYRNLRSELYCTLACNFDLLSLPEEPRYLAEFEEIKLIPDRVPKQVIPKDMIRSRLGFSPDYTDSLAVSTYRHFNARSTGIVTLQSVAALSAMNSKLVSNQTFRKI